jgi:hypothetical protein
MGLQVLQGQAVLQGLQGLQEQVVHQGVVVKVGFPQDKYTTSMNHKIQMFQDIKFYRQTHQVLHNKRLQQV